MVDLPHPRGAAAVARAGARRDPPAARGLEEAGVVGGAHRGEPLREDVLDRRLGGEHLGQRRVGAAVDEAEALAHPIGDREAGHRLPVADRDDLEAEDAVEAVLLGDHLAARGRHPYRQMITSVPGCSANSASTWTARRASAARWLT